MDRLNEIGLIKLENKKMEKINGGCWPCKVLKYGRWALEAAGAYEAWKDIEEGYNACRDK